MSGASIAVAIIISVAASIVPQSAAAQFVEAKVRAPSAADHRIGSPAAATVLIEYSDFQCPFCARAHPTIKKIVADSNGSVGWVFRHFPLTRIHPQAEAAANAAECMSEQRGNDGFWSFAEHVFGNQRRLRADDLEALALQTGADVAAFQACVAAQKHQRRIDADLSEAMANGWRGTPTTVVFLRTKQTAIMGALPFDSFTAAIDAARVRN
jgi:protein-disulfide isomerase